MDGEMKRSSALKIGDQVQWTINGADQFASPLRITSLSECGEYCFVEGGTTGLPVAQVILAGDPITALDTALELHGQGFWPVAIYAAGDTIKTKDGEKTAAGKEPIGRAWGATRQTENGLRATFKGYPQAGAGVCLGPDRGPGGSWLIDLEGDGDQARGSLATLLGGEELPTRGWSATLGNHALFRADGERLLQVLEVAGAEQGKGLKSGVWKLPELPDLEMRIGGYHADGKIKQVQSVVPPTIGTNGQSRRWNGVEAVAELPEAAYAFLDSLAERRAIQAAENEPTNGAVKPEDNAKNNGKAAVRKTVKATSGGNVEARAIAYLAKCDPAISGQGGHDQTFGVACRVGAGFDLPKDVALRLMRVQYNPRCQPPWSEAELEHKVEDAYQRETRRGWLLGNRPDIEVNTERHVCVAATLPAIAADGELYRRGDSLGTVVEEQADSIKLRGGVKLRGGSSRFMPLSEAALSCVLTRNARFFCWKKDANDEWIDADTHPPDWLIKAVATLGSWPGIRSLEGIATAPWIRPDGSIPDPGYDPVTRTVYKPPFKVTTAIPDRPTKEDAKDAATRLFELVSQFPFASDADRAVWLAAVLTAIQRPAIAGPVPGFALNSNAAGTGKGLLIDLVGLISAGLPIPTRSYPHGPTEAAKVKLSLALAAVPMVHFDNLLEGGVYGNSELDSAITSTIVEGRILGYTRESGAVPLRPCWFLSGNNISPGKDAFRRWIPCNLKTELEHPHEREDLKEDDLKRHVQNRRGELLRDALTILKAHAIADRPKGWKALLGSFEEWDQVVRGAVWFATGEDCLTTQRAATADSPERLEKLALMEAWHAIPEGGSDGKGITAVKARDLAEDIPARGNQPAVSTQYPELREALLELSDGSKLPSSNKIGYKIRAMKGQIIGGLRFEKAGEEHRTVLWRVRKL